MAKNRTLFPIVTLKLELSEEVTIKELKASLEAILGGMHFASKRKDDMTASAVKVRVQRVDFE